MAYEELIIPGVILPIFFIGVCLCVCADCKGCPLHEYRVRKKEEKQFGHPDANKPDVFISPLSPAKDSNVLGSPKMYENLPTVNSPNLQTCPYYFEPLPAHYNK